MGYFCEVGYIPYLVYHYVLFLRSDVPGILAMHLRSRKDNAKPEKCYHNFYHVVLRLAWSWRGHTSKVLPRLPTVVLERAGEMSDVEIGWRVGNMR